MFPSRTARTFAALLEIADAMLAPEPFEGPLPEHEERVHPHRLPLESRRRRRLAPERAAQHCVSPVARSTAASSAGRLSAAQASATRSAPR